MDGVAWGAIVAAIALMGGGIGVWVSLRERLVRAETKIETLESKQVEHKSDLQQLKDWMSGQFDMLRNDLARKADRDK